MQNCPFCNSVLTDANTPPNLASQLSDANFLCNTCYDKVGVRDKRIQESLRSFNTESLKLALMAVGPGKTNKQSVSKTINNSGKPKNSVAMGCGILIVVAVIGILIAVFSDSNEAKIDNTPTDYYSDKSKMKLAAFVIIKMKVEERLKAPGSAKFQTISYEDAVTVTADSMFTVNSYVDAQNSFGALLRSGFVGKAKYLGGDPDSTQNWSIMVLMDDDFK
ncbi:MAG: hypothetical protein BGO31_15585 [Bacteroidetes bacterium 43-16]|nr:MAG: hypothetical protein BGO31_15585 [Bacteroidetes bacterium 43-16]